MFEKFSDRARKILQLANQNAQKYNHEQIDTIHLFLGMLQEGSGMACKAIVDVGQYNSLDRLMRKVEADLEAHRGPALYPGIKLPQTPMTKLVIETAIKEASELKKNYIGSEDLLLGLLKVQELWVRSILSMEGITHDKVRTWFVDLQKEELRRATARKEADMAQIVRNAQQDVDKTAEEDPVAEGLSRRVDDAINVMIEYEIQKALKREREEILKEAKSVFVPDHFFIHWLQHRIEGKRQIGEWSVTMVIGTPVIGEKDGKEDHKDR